MKSDGQARGRVYRLAEPRKVDLVAINYAPEVTGIGPYVTDAARWLVRAGWDVRVITGFPHYPQWRQTSDEPTRSTMDGVDVVRVRHRIPADPSISGRFAMEASFARGVLRAGLRPGAVVVLLSPPLVSARIILAALRLRRRRVAVGVWVQDIYSEAMEETGVGGGLGSVLVRRLERGTLRAADGVVVVHPRFRKVVRSLGADDSSIEEIRNWNQARLPVRLERTAARRARELPVDSTIVVHAGNMGAKQGLENVVDAARVAQSRDLDIHFYLVGDGNQRGVLEESAKDVTSHLTFVDPLPDETFHEFLSAADILLVNQQPGVLEMSVPSKLTTYFSLGIPVVAAVAEAGITADDVRAAGAGEVVPAADPAALVEAIERIAADPVLAREIGQCALGFVEQLSVDASMGRFERWLDAMAGVPRVTAETGRSRSNE
ncbi:glycosyltransferase family 4 protein [Gordonia iterans]